MKERRIIEVEEKLPILQTLPLSLQHLFAMFGATVLVPFLLNVRPINGTFYERVAPCCISAFVNGACQATCSSFAFISPVLAVTHTAGLTYGDAQEASLLLGSVSSLWAFL